MKRLQSTLTAAALALCALTANAQSPAPSPWSIAYNPLTSFHSEKTRDQVQAELAQFKQSGVSPWSISYNPLASFHSQRTRAEVRDEYLANREAADAMHGEDSGAAYLAAHRQDANPARRFASQPGAHQAH